jgi:hypothetical protein
VIGAGENVRQREDTYLIAVDAKAEVFDAG